MIETLSDYAIIKHIGNNITIQCPASIPRVEYLEGIATAINGKYSTTGSTAGRVECGNYKIYTKYGSSTGNGTSYETKVVDDFNSLVSALNHPIDIKIIGSDMIFKNITGAVQVNSSIKKEGGAKSDPKADIILVQDGKPILDSGNIYISHKKAGGAEAFQQYSGVSEASGTEINGNPLVQKFLQCVNDKIEHGKLPLAMMMDITDDLLIKRSIYGSAYAEGSTEYSLQCCTLIGQGDIRATQYNGNIYELDFSSGTHLSGDIAGFQNSEYRAVLGATYRAGRGFKLGGTQVTGARVGIYPSKLIAPRCKKELWQVVS